MLALMVPQYAAWLVALILLIFLIGAVELGYRGGRRAAQNDDGSRAAVGMLTGAVIGVLGLLLGFTFSMAISRFESRREALLRESNAIGTAFLRADLLKEPERGALRQTLRKYVDARIEFYHAVQDRERFAASIAQSNSLQNQMWEIIGRAAGKDASPITALNVAAINDVIDQHSARLHALENGIPRLVLYLLAATALISGAIVGYAFGETGRRHWIGSIVFSMIVTLVIYGILDMDRPRQGLIRVEQDRMIELQESMKGT